MRPPTPRQPLPAHPRDEPPDRGPELPQVPGLDGLRALALLAVLVANQGFELGRGGFLGISSAFTLSGFLLATLALAEWSQSSRLVLTRFWERRVRKLVPPALLTVVVVVALQSTLRVGSGPTFRGDVLSALGFVTNWRLAFPAQGFARSFAELSALRHLWPVALTAQVFLLFPLVFMLLMWVTGRQWRIAGIAFGAIAALSFGTAWVMSGDPDNRDLVYYGTHTRVGELLVGVVLGYAVLSPAFRRLLSRPRAMPTVRYGGVVSLAVLAGLWTFVSPESGTLFQGITVLNAVLTAWLILALTMPGPAATVLGVWPLRQLGEISFSVYLLHWPLYLVLDEDRLGLDGAALFGVRLAASLVAGLVLYWVVEAPFRGQVRVRRLQLAMGLGATMAVVMAVVFVLPVNPPAGISLDVDDGNGPGDLDVVSPVGGDDAARVLVIGDEVGASLVGGFQTWNEDAQHRDQQLRVDTHVTEGCPLGGPATLRRLDDEVGASLDCEAWRPRLPKTLEAADVDAIVVVMGTADVGERKIGGAWRHLGQASFDRWMAEQIDGLADVLADQGVPVLWATTPHVRLDDDRPSTQWPDFDDNDPRRIDRLNELIVATVGSRDGFTVVDLDAFLHDLPRGEFNTDFRDGVGFTEAGSDRVAGWLAAQILAPNN